MISPLLWASTPFKNKTAYFDFGGTHSLWHRVVAETAGRAGFTYRAYPLGDAVFSPRWMEAHAREHASANQALGIGGPANLLDYDMRDEQDWASFMFIHAQESQRLRIAAGVS